MADEQEVMDVDIEAKDASVELGATTKQKLAQLNQEFTQQSQSFTLAANDFFRHAGPALQAFTSALKIHSDLAGKENEYWKMIQNAAETLDIDIDQYQWNQQLFRFDKKEE